MPSEIWGIFGTFLSLFAIFVRYKSIYITVYLRVFKMTTENSFLDISDFSKIVDKKAKDRKCS